jgi:hypothetical protein
VPVEEEEEEEEEEDVNKISGCRSAYRSLPWA